VRWNRTCRSPSASTTASTAWYFSPGAERTAGPLLLTCFRASWIARTGFVARGAVVARFDRATGAVADYAVDEIIDSGGTIPDRRAVEQVTEKDRHRP